MVEYILLLSLVVGVAGGMIYQFNDAFKAYANEFFGNYLSCLLETGELPGLQSGMQNFCSDPEYSLALGKAKDGSDARNGSNSGSGSGSGSGDSSDDRGNADASSDSDKNGRGSYAGSSGGSSGQSGQGRFGRSGKGKRSARGGSRGKGLDDGKGESDDVSRTTVNYKSEQEEDEFGFRKNQLNRGYGVDSNEKREDQITTKLRTDTQGKKKKYQQFLKVKERKIAGEKEEDNMDLGLGGFVRIILIIGIIIAIIIFIGGQALQISKEWE